MHCFSHTLAEFARIDRYFIEESGQQFLFFDELQPSDGILGQLDCLVESIFLALTDIHCLDDQWRQAIVNIVIHHNLTFDVCCTRNHNALHCWLVVLDEHLVALFSHFPDLILPFLQPQPPKTRS